MNLAAIASKLTMTDLQELIMRCIINDAVHELVAEGQAAMTDDMLRDKMISRGYAERLVSPRDVDRELTSLIPKYVGEAWLNEAIFEGKVVALTNDEADLTVEALREENVQDQASLDERDDPELPSKIQARDELVHRFTSP